MYSGQPDVSFAPATSFATLSEGSETTVDTKAQTQPLPQPLQETRRVNPISMAYSRQLSALSPATDASGVSSPGPSGPLLLANTDRSASADVGLNRDLASTAAVSFESHYVIPEAHVSSPGQLQAANGRYAPTASDGPHYSPVAFGMYTIPRKKESDKKEDASYVGMRLPLGIILSPLVSLVSRPPRLLRTPIRCNYCTAVLNRFKESVGLDGSWKCPFCGRTNQPSQGLKEDSSPETYPETTLKVVEFEDPTDQPYTLEQLAGNYTSLLPLNIFILDITTPSKDFELLKNAIVESINSLPPDSRIALVTFSNSVSIYDLVSGDVISADILPGSKSLDLEGEHLLSDNVSSRYLANLQTSKEHIIKSLKVIRGSLVAPEVKQLRCLGVALETAIEIIRISNPKGRYSCGGRISVFLNSSPNYGPGSLPDRQEHQDYNFLVEKATAYYKALGMEATSLNATIDLFCGGHNIFNIPIIQNLAAPCGGNVIMSRCWDEKFRETLQISLSRSCGRDMSLEIITSDSILVSQIIGPVATHEAVEDLQEHESGIFKHVCKIGDAQPGQSLSIYFEYDEDILSDYVYFQFNIKYTTFDNQRICRVVTHRLFTSDLISDVLQSVDTEVTSVLMAKNLALKAMKYSEKQAISSLDDSMVTFCLRYNSQTRGRTFVIPEHLQPLQRRMYNLRRGSLLGPILHNLDDSSYLRSLFLSRNVDDSIRIMEPVLYMIDYNLAIERVAATTLTLQSDYILVMDQQTEIFIWYGRMVALEDERMTVAREKAKGLSKGRFPSPSIMEFKEGTSMARWLVCRLEPAHKESLEEQIRLMPSLQTMTRDAYDLLLRKIPRSDELSFTQYFNHLAFSMFN